MPGPHSSTINWDNINSITKSQIMPTVEDQIFRSNPLMLRLWQEGTKEDGGAFIVQPLLYGEGPAMFFAGMETLPTDDADQVTAAVFNWKQAVAAITISRIDELKNTGPNAMAKLLAIKTEYAQESMRNMLGQGIYSDGLANVKSIVGLQAMVSTNVSYGGISKTNNAFWQSKVNTTATQLSVPLMRNILGQCTEGRHTPNMITSPQVIYDLAYALVEPQKRFGSEMMAKAGFTSILWENRPWVVDSHCPDSNVFMLNTASIDFVSHSDENMRFEDFQKPHNQAGRSAFIFWAGNLVGGNCRRQGRLTAITS